MADTRFGQLTPEQYAGYLKRLHSQIHWLLLYAEKNSPDLEGYFDKVQMHIAGLNSLMNYPSSIVDLCVLVECARTEYDSPNYDFKRFRKIVLDAHEVIDRMENNVLNGSL